VQFRFLASPEIEAGALDRFRVLILPYSIAISDKEKAEIERFMRRGGVVYADDQTGRMDERCHWRQKPLWTGPIEGLRRSRPDEFQAVPPLGIQGQFVRTVRDLGQSRLTGLLPRSATKVKLPPATGLRYDLLRGGLAADELEASPEQPALLLERSSRIARLEVDAGLQIRLTDEHGQAVDRSVVHVEVFDPAGRLVRYYSGNADVVGGTAKFSIPFALSDMPGQWRVKVRDVISGLEANQEVPVR
jgi:hypothetical protein